MTEEQPNVDVGEGAPEAEPQAEAVTAPPVTDEAILAALRELLKTADMQTTTEKLLRKQLEEKFGVELADKKKMIRAEVEAFLAEQEPEGDEDDEAEEEEEEPAPRKSRKRSSGSALGSFLSPAMSAFLGVDRMPRPQVVKAIWDYIRANNLQDPKDKRNIMLDDKLKTIFNPPINMFSMNKQLSKHCKTSDVADGGDDDEDDDGDDDGGDDEPKPKKARKAPAKKSGGDGEGKRNGFQKPVRISQELADFIGGTEPISRPELTKKFWEYFRSNNLQDPSDKRMILCDERLQSLLGVKSFQAFGLMKYLKTHILKD